MDGYISFSELNDFLFCPESLALHTLYKNYKTATYHDTSQTDGKAAHETIDTDSYQRGGWETGVWLCSPELHLYGRCDLYHPESGALVERKRTIHKLYDGQRMQIWAQALCLQDMHRPVHTLTIHSLTDNRRYHLDPPDETIRTRVQALVVSMRQFHPGSPNSPLPAPAKCARCIYAPLCPFINQT